MPLPTGLRDAGLPARACAPRRAGPVPVAEQHLGAVCQVGREEAPGPSAACPAGDRATCAGQGLGKGRQRASLSGAAESQDVPCVHASPRAWGSHASVWGECSCPDEGETPRNRLRYGGRNLPLRLALKVPCSLGNVYFVYC